MTPLFRLFLFLSLLPADLAFADPDLAFTEGNRLYEAGDFAGAASAYEKVVREGHLSPDLFYNLGAAKQRLGENGEAVLWMRRALVTEPGMPEATQSLAFLQTRLAWFEFAGNRVERVLAALPPSFGPWALSLGLWIGALALAARHRMSAAFAREAHTRARAPSQNGMYRFALTWPCAIPRIPWETVR